MTVLRMMHIRMAWHLQQWSHHTLCILLAIALRSTLPLLIDHCVPTLRVRHYACMYMLVRMCWPHLKPTVLQKNILLPHVQYVLPARSSSDVKLDV
jgi:hypothetical protein